ncbi:cytochrome c oxidase assembly protein [Sneathiella glossodoripedis]|uniref:cytochrome c oxidase assembly protein n=1 Tax=Sneathiella glossodoripedis TaxID=418853 RepID=UPI00046EAE67|nr:cytochrome c oxidase assembly protein [Sneathiella glossodoripedis]
MSTSDRKSKRLAWTLCGVAVAMVGLAYASVPLYDLFCRVTGYGGTTQVASEESDVILDRKMTIDFDANTARDMAWEFKPVKRKMELQVGQTAIAFYEAYNPTDKPITGTATFNVSPQKVGQYFNKIECFCFTEQTLMPGQKIDMPVTFYVDPAIDEDVNAEEVTTITLSYTFFVADKEEESDAVDETAAVGITTSTVN